MKITRMDLNLDKLSRNAHALEAFPILVVCSVGELKQDKGSGPTVQFKRFLIDIGEDGIKSSIDKEKANSLLTYVNRGYRISIRAVLDNGKIWRGTYYAHGTDLAAFVTDAQHKKNEKKGTAKYDGMAEVLSGGSRPLTDVQKSNIRLLCRKALKERLALLSHG